MKLILFMLGCIECGSFADALPRVSKILLTRRQVKILKFCKDKHPHEYKALYQRTQQEEKAIQGRVENIKSQIKATTFEFLKRASKTT